VKAITLASALRSREHRALQRFDAVVGGPARRGVIVLLACVLALDSADKATVGAVGVQLERGLHIGNASLGLLVAVTSLTGGLGAIPAGGLVDRVRRTHLLPIAIALWSVAMIISGVAVSFGMLLITRVALGAIVATAGPSVASLTGDYFPGSERARIYGFIISGELVGAAFGFLISGEVAKYLSWRFSFALLAVPGLALAWVIWRRLPEPARGGQSRLAPGAQEIRGEDDIDPDAAAGSAGETGFESGRSDELTAQAVKRRAVAPREPLVLREDPARLSLWRTARYVVRVPTNVRLIIASALGYFFFAGLRTFAVVFVRGHFGVGQSEATLLLGVIVIASIGGALLGGRLADRLIGGGRLTGRLLVAAGAYAAAAVILGPAIATTSLAVAIPLFILGAAALAAPNPPLDAARLDIMPARLWGRAEGVRTLLRSFAEALAPFLFGVISEQLAAHHHNANATSSGFGANSSAQGLEYTFLIMLVPLLISAFLMLRAGRTYPRDIATAIAGEDRRGYDRDRG